jgi:catechol 2,3-dioxygenase-like lactoylglutathione lyase family enzyme
LADRIDHIAVTVADLEQAIRWYTSSFACQLLQHDRTQATLRFDNIDLVLTLPSSLPGHLAFCRRDAATLGELHELADGRRSTLIADPAGTPVEIIEASSE